VSFAFDCLLASYLMLASLTIWCAQVTSRLASLDPELETAQGPMALGKRQADAVIRFVEPCLASLPHALGSLACLIGALSLTVGAPFDLRYAAIAVLGVAFYLVLINFTHLTEDWQNGVPARRMVCVRSLLPALLAAPLVLAGLRLL